MIYLIKLTQPCSKNTIAKRKRKCLLRRIEYSERNSFRRRLPFPYIQFTYVVYYSLSNQRNGFFFVFEQFAVLSEVIRVLLLLLSVHRTRTYSSKVLAN